MYNFYLVSGTMKTCILLLSCVALAAAYVNDFDEEFTFSCQEGRSINWIMSEHNSDKEDRRFDFGVWWNPLKRTPLEL